MNRKPSYSKLLKQRADLIGKLSNWPAVLRGSIRRHGNKCGNPGCRCKDPKNPILHGPYHYLSHRYRDKTQTIFLNEVKLTHAREWIANYKALIEHIYKLSEINFRVLRYHYDKLELNPDGIGKRHQNRVAEKRRGKTGRKNLGNKNSAR